MSDTSSKKNRAINSLGVVLIVVAYAGAVFNMLRVKGEEVWAGKKTIRICHWQLEAGFREAMDWAIAEYEKIHPDVKVIQQPIYERAYKQYVNTQLIAGTAPDLIELGLFTGGSGSEQNVTGRYFRGLGKEVYKPNPYNAGTDLAGVPWIRTFKANLEPNWDNRNLDYYSAGPTVVSSRLVYNKDLYRKIMGHERIPSTFSELLDVCRRARHYRDSTGIDVFPIASSRQQVKELGYAIRARMLTNYIPLIDTDFDWLRDSRESFLAWVEGKYDLEERELQVTEEMLKELASYFQPGFMAKGRMDSQASFVQQRALMINTGSWGMTGLVVQAKDAGFELGVMKFPNPAPDGKYGKYFDAQAAESNKTFNAPIAVSRFSKHPDVALDFLKFWTSQKIAEAFCKKAGWLCGIKNTENIDYIDPFEPDFRGIPGDRRPLFELGYETIQLFRQKYWAYITGKTEWSEFVDAVEKKFPDRAIDDFKENIRGIHGNLLSISQGYSSCALRLKFATGQQEREHLNKMWRYRADSYASLFAQSQGSLARFRNLAKHSTNRVESIKETRGYTRFAKTFFDDRL